MTNELNIFNLNTKVFFRSLELNIFMPMKIFEKLSNKLYLYARGQMEYSCFWSFKKMNKNLKCALNLNFEAVFSQVFCCLFSIFCPFFSIGAHKTWNLAS